MTRCASPDAVRRTIAGATLLAFAASGVGLPRTAGAADPVSGLLIVHEPLACVTASETPSVEASITPGPNLAKGYVYFRAAGTEDFYYVVMGGEADALSAKLPRPLPETKGIDYHLQALDTAQLSRRTPDYQPPVTAPGICRAPRAAPVPPSGAGLTVGLTRPGQTPVPPGFNRKDIASVILVTGAVVTLAAALELSAGGGAAAGVAAAGASAGSGVSTAAVVAGAAVVGGAAAVVASNSGSSSDEPPTIQVGATTVAGGAPLTIVFTAFVADRENDTPYTVAWSLGDGTTASGFSVTHTYANPGTFTVTATATDSKHKSGTSSPLVITVLAPSPAVFVVASVSWSGLADVDLQVLDASGNSVGQNLPAGCETPANRTEQVLLEGASLVNGSYTAWAHVAAICPSGPPPTSITAIGNVMTSAGVAKCPPAGYILPADGTPVALCSFTLP